MNTTPTKKVAFLIDDDTFLLDIYLEKAKHSDVELLSFSRAEDALVKLRAGVVPDVFVVDLILPGMSGIDFIKTIRAEHLADGVPVIVLTNKSEPPYPEEAYKLDIDQYIVKATFLPSEVMGAIHNLLDHNNPKPKN